MNSSFGSSDEVFHGLVPIERGLLWVVEHYKHDGDQVLDPDITAEIQKPLNRRNALEVGQNVVVRKIFHWSVLWPFDRETS